MQDHYGQDYDDTVADAGDSPERWLWRRDVLLRHKSMGAVLDIGCSAGGFLEIMSRSSWAVSGIEMSEAMAQRAAKRSGANIFVGDVLAAPFERESFDAVTCFHVLEHMYRPRHVLARIYKWLKPGGVLYLMVPNIDSAGARIFGSSWSGLELPRHLYHFSPRSLRVLIGSTGFDEVSLTTQREVFLEASLRYVLDGMLRKIGLEPHPLAQTQRAWLPWRIIRKGLRLTVLPLGMALTKLAGDGETIHGIFRKA
jgi:SAM-dependent methyltransferase